MSKTLIQAIIAALLTLVDAFKAEMRNASDDSAEETAGRGTSKSPLSVKGKGVKGKAKAPVDDDEEEEEEEPVAKKKAKAKAPVEDDEPPVAKKKAKAKAPVEDDEEEEEEEESELTLADLRKQARPVIKAGYSDEIKDLLETFDADSLTTLEESDYEAFSKKLTRLSKKLGV